MTASERDLLNARIGELLHAVFVQIRAKTFPQASIDATAQAEINQLADLVENFPRYIIGHDEFAVRTVEQLREEVLRYVRKFYPNIDPSMHRYVQLLDMDAGTFLARFRDHNWSLPEPEPAETSN